MLIQDGDNTRCTRLHETINVSCSISFVHIIHMNNNKRGVQKSRDDFECISPTHTHAKVCFSPTKVCRLTTRLGIYDALVVKTCVIMNAYLNGLRVLTIKKHGGGCNIFVLRPNPSNVFSQASSLVLSTRHMLHRVQNMVLRELVEEGNYIWYVLWTSEVLPMANSCIALVWCGSRLDHKTRVSGHVRKFVSFHMCVVHFTMMFVITIVCHVRVWHDIRWQDQKKQ